MVTMNAGEYTGISALWALAVFSVTLLTSCGGGGGSGSPTVETPVPGDAPVAFIANPWPRDTVEILSPASGSRATINSLSSDGAGGWIARYSLVGRSGTVHLTSSDRVSGDRYEKWLFDDDLFVTLELEDLQAGAEFDVFDAFVNYDGSIYEGYYIHGTPTPPSALPRGSATWRGTFTGERQWIDDIASDPENRHPLLVYLRANARLTFNFSDQTIGGLLDGFEVRTPSSSFSPLSDPSLSIMRISGDRLSGSHFVAGVSGAGQLSAYDGKLDGAFYGPAASDVGAVLSATGGENDALLGYIAAKRTDDATADPGAGGRITEADLVAALTENSDLLLDAAGNAAYAVPSFGSVTLSGGSQIPRGYVSNQGSLLHYNEDLLIYILRLDGQLLTFDSTADQAVRTTPRLSIWRSQNRIVQRRDVLLTKRSPGAFSIASVWTEEVDWEDGTATDYHAGGAWAHFVGDPATHSYTSVEVGAFADAEGALANQVLDVPAGRIRAVYSGRASGFYALKYGAEYEDLGGEDDTLAGADSRWGRMARFLYQSRTGHSYVPSEGDLSIPADSFEYGRVLGNVELVANFGGPITSLDRLGYIEGCIGCAEPFEVEGIFVDGDNGDRYEVDDVLDLGIDLRLPQVWIEQDGQFSGTRAGEVIFGNYDGQVTWAGHFVGDDIQAAQGAFAAEFRNRAGGTRGVVVGSLSAGRDANDN